MANGGPSLAAAYPSLSNHSTPRQHHLPQPSVGSSGRRAPFIAALSLDDRPRANMAPNSSASPPNIKNEFGGVGTGIAYGAPLSAVTSPDGPSGDKTNGLGFGFIRNLADNKKLTRDGQPAKRRGPKPDSKPALTRRQELNRQAQRTHRERKELYIKALEEEVLRLKEVYSNVSQDKERLAEENRSLKVLLQHNGLSVSAGTPIMDDNLSRPSVGPYMGSGSSPSGSGSYALHSASTQNTPYTPPPGSALSTTGAMPRGLSPLGGLSPNQAVAGLNRHSPSGQAPQRNPGVDYDQAGIDFVLNLERPCMNHMPWLLERSSANGGKEPCGHALMASCPPEPFSELTTAIPFGHRHGNRSVANGRPVQQQTPSGRTDSNVSASAAVNRNFSRTGSSHVKGMATTGNLNTATTAMDIDGTAPPRTWELSKADLATLLDLSQKLDLDGEITPVMAWGMVLGHPRLGELNEKDFARLSEELTSKVRCYGFGAVLEEFEVRDALEAIYSIKPEPLGTNGHGF